jgi:23S rRNA pseudouridine1911/1915/1917 synthase
MLLDIIYEDDILLVVDKPPGLAVYREGNLATSEDTVADLLCNQYPELGLLGEEMRYGIVHRLDKDTSGLLLVAKTKKAFAFFQDRFQQREVRKRYICLVHGLVKEDEGVIDAKLARSPNDRRKQKAFTPGAPGENSAREARTKYRVVERFAAYTLLEMAPETGRKHQIRAHLASLHHPIAGDKLYGFKGQEAPTELTRQFLHASHLTISMPDGSIKEFHSELPKDLKDILENLRI